MGAGSHKQKVKLDISELEPVLNVLNVQLPKEKTIPPNTHTHTQAWIYTETAAFDDKKCYSWVSLCVLMTDLLLSAPKKKKLYFLELLFRK